jgi:hypothetical protein
MWVVEEISGSKRRKGYNMKCCGAVSSFAWDIPVMTVLLQA